MCILFLYTDPKLASGKFRLVLAANRDEYFKRPSKKAHFWENFPSVIGGQDMEPGKEGGSWLAMSKTGRIAALLNVIGKNDKNLAGRGSIVSEFVKETKSLDTYFQNLEMHGHTFSGFNLVTLQLGSEKTDIYTYSNDENFGGKVVNEMSRIIGIGNSVISKPHKKIIAGMETFSDIVSQYNNTSNKKELVKKLLELLQNKERHFPDPVMVAQAPNYPIDKLEKLSSVFVDISESHYGTRAHTIILVDADGNVDFEEHSIDGDSNNVGNWTKVHHFFQLAFE